MIEENNKMVNEITALVTEVKSKLSKEINNSIVYVYWNIGRIIVSNENEYRSSLGEEEYHDYREEIDSKFKK